MPPSQPSRPDWRFDSSQLGDFGRSIRTDPAARTPLLVGLIGGLLVGLLIGWVLWPVNWTNAYPADLNAESKAQYLAAVADAYVAARGPDALDLANQRLAHIGPDVAGEFDAAIQQFSNSSERDKLIRVTNLQELGAALGLTLAPSSAEPADEDGDTGWGTWLLVLLLFIAVIAAAVYGLRRSNSARWIGPGGAEELEGPEYRSEEARTRADTFTPPHAEQDMPAGGTPRTLPAYALDDQFSGGEMMGDEDESEDNEGVLRHYDEPMFDDDTIDAGFRPADVEAEQPPAGGRGYAEPAEQRTPAQPAAQQATPPPASDRVGRSRVIDSPTAYYQMGVADYDQTFNIADPGGAGYLGECGMGVNLKNGMVRNSSDHVIAFDVWLFDKADERQMNTQTRILISEYVVDNNLESVFAKERENESPPIVAQPGVAFKLEGRNLVLDCVVSEAVYSKNPASTGVFQSLKVDMKVLRRQ